MSDGALMRIAMDRAELTLEAGAALDAELAKRGVGEEQQREFAVSYRAEVAADQPRRVSGKNFRSTPFGTAFHGKRDLKEMQNRVQYQATRWLTGFFIPLMPLGSY